MIEEKKLIQLLSKVIDNVSGKDIVTNLMLKNVKVEEQNIQIDIQLPNAKYPAKFELHASISEMISNEFPNANINVHFITQNPQIQEAPRSLPQVKNIIAVASGKGGVGKSTVAVNLALALQQMGARVGLIDADLYGPSIPTMFGLQGQRPKVQNINGKPRIVPIHTHGIALMSIGFIIEPEQAVVLRGPRLSGVIRQFIQECAWPPLDYMVIDLPPGTGDIQLTLVQTAPVTGAIIVTTPQEVAVVDAVKAMNMFLLPTVNVPILGVVENMSWFTPKELPNNKYYLFGEGGGKKIAKLSQSMLLGQIPLVQGIREAGDTGKPAVINQDDTVQNAFKKVAENTLRQLAIRNEMLPPTRIIGTK